MTIEEIFLGSFFQVLFDKLTSLGLDYAQREGIRAALLNKWKGMLETINAVLDDAEDKQLNNDRLVKPWLEDVRDLAYDMEDLLDEFEIEATQAKSEADSSTRGGQLKRKFCFFSQPRSLVSETKLQEINGRFEEIITRKALLSLREDAGERSHSTNKRLPSTSLPELGFFGREEEEAQVLELLINDVKNSNATLSIVPIVGMGGVGKTALAQQLYNDARVTSCFEKRAWVCVSDVFDILDLTKTILRSVTKLPYEDKDLNELQVKLKDNLSGKKFLVVLDDVWNEKYEEWTSFSKPFEAGAKGSKIIITTRNLPVVHLMGALPYPLKELSIGNCTSLLAYHALGARNFERHPDLETIGKKIAGKCRGLPLAAKILGGLLRNKENPNEWETILNNRLWDATMEKNNEILPALKLSYVHLPSYLKRCFVYCSIFPKDYEFERDELVLLWIAEGFLEGQKAKENILRLGRNYFDELVSRSFFQQSNVHKSKFLMHDLLNDLAKSIAGATSFTFGESQVVGDEDDASFREKARYASCMSPWYVTSRCLRGYDRMKVLRSLIILRVGGGQLFISNKVLHDLLAKLKYLRVFSLCHCSFIEIPECVSDLKHLRYLNFSYTRIRRLPESIGALCKLQALILRGCQELSMLPSGITKLVNLQFLDIRDTDSLKEMPLGISNLKNLTILSKFVVSAKKGSQVKELKNLPHLQGELFISELQKVEHVGDSVDANLFGKPGLSKLSLCWNESFGNLRNDECEARVLHFLRPHPNLKILTISYYGGDIFPLWLGDSCYSKMVSLCLQSCPNVTSLPALGQLPQLKQLSLEDLNAVSLISSEFYGARCPFPSLTSLKFKQMSVWRNWSCYVGGQEREVSFSCLQHLAVQSCPTLIGTLPSQLDHLRKLEIRSCPHLNISTNVVSLPSLHELYFEDCNKEILKNFVNLTSLTLLKIDNLGELVYFDLGFMISFVKLKELHIRSCHKLTYLWEDGKEMRGLTCLQRVVIESCPRFTSFVAGDRETELPCNLERMELKDCMSLEELPSRMQTLRYLSINNCPKIIGQTIPPSDPSNNNSISQLEHLLISHYNSLTFFPFVKGRLAALKMLHIVGCKGVWSLERITVESLESLAIGSCYDLGSLSQDLYMLSHLTNLKIWDCPALKIEDFPPLPLTLSCLTLWDCPKIKSLPNKWHHLTSLRTLRIGNCQNIKCLPEGGLPPNLRWLIIGGCENLKQPVREWGLHLLTSLEELSIDGRSLGGEGEKVWFPSEDKDAWSLVFPSSLTDLQIFHMSNVERLSNGLRNHLSSLQTLWIGDWPKLRYLPEDGLPPSLQELHIVGCKILQHRCSKLTGDYWPLIQEIPLIDI